MVVIYDEPAIELNELSVGDVFNLQDLSGDHYYMVLSREDVDACSDCPCVSLEDGRIHWLVPDTVVLSVIAKLYVNR